MITLMLLAGLAITPPNMSGMAQNVNLQCGLKPLPPLGCKREDAVCVCDQNGNCQWQFVCN